jgi:hypothetical protein
MNKTVVWGVCADSTGIVEQYADEVKRLPGGGVRVETRTRVEREPASAYADVHSGPMPLLWQHGEQIGRVLSLRRAHGNLYAVAETEELEPADLAALAAERGLVWSTGTNNRRHEPLRITEISLTPEGATVGLPPVHWWKLDVVKGNLPLWVSEDLDRASRTEHRSRGVLRVHEVGSTISAADKHEQLGRDLGLRPGGYEHRIDPGGYGELEYSNHPGRILSVNGRPV